MTSIASGQNQSDIWHLHITHNDGIESIIKVHDQLTLKIDSKHIAISASDAQDETKYLIENINSFKYSLYDDSSVEQILNKPEITLNKNGITIIQTGSNGSINIFELDGRLVQRYTFKDRIDVGFENLSKGIYIININNSSNLKIQI